MSNHSNKLNRRDFLKTTVSTTAVSVAAGSFFIGGIARVRACRAGYRG
jgi:hypothetical protein